MQTGKHRSLYLLSEALLCVLPQSSAVADKVSVHLDPVNLRLRTGDNTHLRQLLLLGSLGPAVQLLHSDFKQPLIAAREGSR